MISVVLSGPLHVITLHSVEYYLNQGCQVVLSTWNTEAKFNYSNAQFDLPPLQFTLDTFKEIVNENFTLIISEYMDVSEFNNHQNIYYHAYAWLKGLQKARGDYVLKVRTSCIFRNWSKIKQSIEENSEKVICSSIFFRPGSFSQQFYCPSDFMIGLKKYKAERMLEKLLVNLEQKVYNQTTSAEKKICTSYFQSIGLQPEDRNSKKYMLEHYIILNVNDLNSIMYWSGRPQGAPTIEHHRENSIPDIKFYIGM